MYASGYFKVNNPGNGDCGFFSFAIGLIPHLQKELASNNQATPLLNKLIVAAQKKAATSTSFVFDKQAEQTFKNSIQTFDFLKWNEQVNLQQNLALLDTFNILLRYILVQAKEQDMQQSVEPVRLTEDKLSIYQENLSVYLKKIKTNMTSNLVIMDAISLFRYYCGATDYDKGCFNSDIYRDSELCDEIRSLAKQWKTVEAENAKKSDVKNDGNNASDAKTKNETDAKEDLQYSFIIANLLTNPSSEKQQQQIRIEEGSPIQKFIAKKMNLGCWATDGDLLVLAEHLDIQLKIYHSGKDNSYGNKDDARPIVRINNFGSLHWTTLINAFPALAKRIPLDVDNKAKTFAKTVSLTVDEIKLMLDDYTMGSHPSLLPLWKRHNLQQANVLLNLCKTETNVKTLVDKYIETVNGIKSNPGYYPDGDFTRICDYICYRFYGRGVFETISLLESTTSSSSSSSLQTQTSSSSSSQTLSLHSVQQAQTASSSSSSSQQTSPIHGLNNSINSFTK